MVDSLKIALETCCKGCNQAQYYGPYSNFDKFHANDKFLVMPVQSFEKSKMYFGRDYIFMSKVNSVNFYEKFSASSFIDQQLVRMGNTVKNAWPFFICLIWLCLLAGMMISFIVCITNYNPSFSQLFSNFFLLIVCYKRK